MRRNMEPSPYHVARAEMNTAMERCPGDQRMELLVEVVSEELTDLPLLEKFVVAVCRKMEANVIPEAAFNSLEDLRAAYLKAGLDTDGKYIEDVAAE